MLFSCLRCAVFDHIFSCSCFSAHLRIACHDGVVAVVIQGGCNGVKRAGPIGVAADPVVLAPLGDLLAVFEPVDLRHKVRVTVRRVSSLDSILKLGDNRGNIWHSALSLLLLLHHQFILKSVITISLMLTEPGSQPRPAHVLTNGPPFI